MELDNNMIWEELLPIVIDVYGKITNHQLSLKAYSKIIKFLENRKEYVHPLYYKTIFFIGVIYMDNKKFSKALRFFKIAKRHFMMNS
jgi:hypothetical protein